MRGWWSRRAPWGTTMIPPRLTVMNSFESCCRWLRVSISEENNWNWIPLWSLQQWHEYTEESPLNRKCELLVFSCINLKQSRWFDGGGIYGVIAARAVAGKCKEESVCHKPLWCGLSSLLRSSAVSVGKSVSVAICKKGYRNCSKGVNV